MLENVFPVLTKKVIVMLSSCKDRVKSRMDSYFQKNRTLRQFPEMMCFGDCHDLNQLLKQSALVQFWNSMQSCHRCRFKLIRYVSAPQCHEQNCRYYSRKNISLKWRDIGFYTQALDPFCVCLMGPLLSRRSQGLGTDVKNRKFSWDDIYINFFEILNGNGCKT